MPQRRSFLAAMLTLVVLALIMGAPMVRTELLTVLVPLAVPAAAGLPVGVPPLWLPVGQPPLAWVADTLGAAAMVLVAALVLRRVLARRPDAGRGRVWAGVLGASVLGIVAAAVLRGTAWSLLTEPSLTVYAGSLLATVTVSALVGAVVGALVGLLAVLVAYRDAALVPG